MIRNIYHKPRIDWLALFMLAWLLVILLSCNVIKGKRSTRASTDSISQKSASVVDTGSGGSTRVSTKDSKETFDWSKLTIQYPPGQRDTNITNIYNYPQKPATVIYETGKATSEHHDRDSLNEWFKNALQSMQNSVDSLHREQATSEKDKKTTPSIWFYVAVFAAVLVCWKGLGFIWTWFTGKYHILLPKSKA